MQVNACMTRDVELVSPQDTIQTAAQAMAKADTGALPVGEGDRLVGMITDRGHRDQSGGQRKGSSVPGRRRDERRSLLLLRR